MVSFHLPSPAPLWVEIGRASPGAASPWTVWIAALADGRTLYRTLVLADGFASVMVELQARRSVPLRTLHKRECRLPEARAEETLQALLGAADTAAASALAQATTPGRPRSGQGFRDSFGEEGPAVRQAPSRGEPHQPDARLPGSRSGSQAGCPEAPCRSAFTSGRA